MSDTIDLYAEALLAVVGAEGNVNEVRGELARIAQAFDSSDELRQTLTDPHIPADRRQQIVQDILQGQASNTTTGLVTMIVATGRIRDLSNIVSRFNELTSSKAATKLAEVRSAVELTPDQRERLAAALTAKEQHPVELVTVVDPSVLGGVVVQIGDTVIDGSVRNRLAQLRDAI